MKRPVSLFNPDKAVEAELDALTREYHLCCVGGCIKIVGAAGDKCVDHAAPPTERLPANQHLF